MLDVFKIFDGLEQGRNFDIAVGLAFGVKSGQAAAVRQIEHFHHMAGRVSHGNDVGSKRIRADVVTHPLHDFKHAQGLQGVRREIGSAEALAPGIIDLQRAGFGCGNAFIKAW